MNRWQLLYLVPTNQLMVSRRLTSTRLTQLMTQPQLTHKEVVTLTVWWNLSRRINVLVWEVSKQFGKQMKKVWWKMSRHHQHPTAMTSFVTKPWQSYARCHFTTKSRNCTECTPKQTSSLQEHWGYRIVIWTEPKQHITRRTTAILQCPYTLLLPSLQLSTANSDVQQSDCSGDALTIGRMRFRRSWMVSKEECTR